jgi:adenylate kinase family enzyme
MVMWAAPLEAGTMSIPRRIALIGTSGAGKTTLGREIARRLHTVFVEIDAIQHKAHWTKATVEELRAGIEAQIGGHDRWVIDDTCQRELGDFVSGCLDVILWLDLPLLLKLGRLCRRSWRRVRTREVLWNGNFETWRDVFVGKDSVLVHATLAHFRHRRTFPARPDAQKIVRLRTPSEVDRWLSSTFSANGAPSAPPNDMAAEERGAG